MSYTDGMAAINLEMPARVPRTEYSAESHWDLIKAVTGIDVGIASGQETKTRASKAFMKTWNYDFLWSVRTTGDVFAEKRSHMGHAVYAAGGVDYNTRIDALFREPEDVYAFDPWETYGEKDKATLTREYEEHYRANCAFYPDAVNMTGIYITCISGLIDILGWDMLLMAAGLDSEAFGAMTDRYSSWIGQYFEALAAADVPVVMIHDDIVWTAGPFIHPQWYRRFVFPSYKRHFSLLRESGKKIIYTSDGNYTAFIDDIAACGVHGFVMEPTTNMRYVAEKYGRTHVFIGNADTRVLLTGTKEEIRAEVKRCMDIGKSCPGFFMAVGNHIPPNTPIENALYYNKVYEEMSRR
jgi:hypothetical protein